MQTILVIEDEAQTRKVLLNCLKFEGYKAIEADNGRTGIKLAREHHPDLIVCDIMMPDLDGYGVLSMLRQQLSTLAIPIIFLTAKVSMLDLRLGMNLGAEDYLEIAKISKYIVIEKIPQFDEFNSNQQQRFITLIDVIYDKSIPISVTANQSLDEFTSSKSLEKTFKRTLSRLYELTSK